MTNVFFSIPLAPKTNEEAWAGISSKVSDTLCSVLAQTDPNIEVVISGHEKPDIPEMLDARVTFIECTFPKPQAHEETMRDKSRKKKSNIREIKARGGGYVMMLDADDLVHKGLAEHFREAGAPHGYIIEQGYMEDTATGVLAPLPGARPGPFHRYCGSCAAFFLTPEDIGLTEDEHKASYYGRFNAHGKWQETAAIAGRPLQPIPFPAAVYRFNVPGQHSNIARETEEISNIIGGIYKHALPDSTSEMLNFLSRQR